MRNTGYLLPKSIFEQELDIWFKGQNKVTLQKQLVADILTAYHNLRLLTPGIKQKYAE